MAHVNRDKVRLVDSQLMTGMEPQLDLVTVGDMDGSGNGVVHGNGGVRNVGNVQLVHGILERQVGMVHVLDLEYRCSAGYGQCACQNCA